MLVTVTIEKGGFRWGKCVEWWVVLVIIVKEVDTDGLRVSWSGSWFEKWMEGCSGGRGTN